MQSRRLNNQICTKEGWDAEQKTRHREKLAKSMDDIRSLSEISPEMESRLARYESPQMIIRKYQTIRPHMPVMPLKPPHHQTVPSRMASGLAISPNPYP